MPINKALGSEGSLSVLDVRFKNIANLDMHLFADMRRNHNLDLVPYRNEVHEPAAFVHSLTSGPPEWRFVLQVPVLPIRYSLNLDYKDEDSRR